MTREELQRVVDEANAAGTVETTTDICPPGAFTLAGRPARLFSAADRRILQIVVRSAADNPVTDDEYAQLLIYLATHVTPAQIRDLWRQSRDPGKLRERVWAWAASIPASTYARMELDAGPLLGELSAMQRIIDSQGEGTAEAADPRSQTGSPVS